MKKILVTLLISALFLGLVGCSKPASSEKTEEELRAEIRAELEAEQKAQGEAKEASSDNKEESQSQENEKSSKLDVHDKEGVFEFIKSKYPEFTEDDFEKWTKKFLDVTGDGTDEIIFTSTYRDGNLDSAIIVTVKDNKYKEISKYMHLAKYENEITMKDGFLVHTSKSGGSGIGQWYRDLYIYDGSALVLVESNIPIEAYFAGPKASYEIKSNIEGSLKDFVITYTKKDLMTEEKEIIGKDKYEYDGNYSMSKTPISLSNTAKTFDSIYNGSNLLETIRYFDENIYHFGEKERVVFAEKIFEKLSEYKNEFSQWGEFIELPKEYYNSETYEYDITNLDDSMKSIMVKIKNLDMFTLVKKFSANEGEINDLGFDIMLETGVYHMLETANEILKDKNKLDEFPFLKADIYFDSSYMTTRVVTDTHLVYPNVLVNKYDDVLELKGKDTWKTTLSLRVNIVGNSEKKTGQLEDGDKETADQDGEINREKVYNIEDLSVGDKVSGMTISELDFDENDKVAIVLDGYTVVLGSISYVENEYLGENILMLSVKDSYIFNEGIKVTFAKDKSNEFTYTFKPSSLPIMNSDFFTKDQLNKLKEGKKIEGKIELSQITHAAKFESEGYEGCKIQGLLDTAIVE